MGDNCVNITRLWICIQAGDSQHRRGSSDNARKMLSINESKRDFRPGLLKRQYGYECHKYLRTPPDGFNFTTFICSSR